MESITTTGNVKRDLIDEQSFFPMKKHFLSLLCDSFQWRGILNSRQSLNPLDFLWLKQVLFCLSHFTLFFSDNFNLFLYNTSFSFSLIFSHSLSFSNFHIFLLLLLHLLLIRILTPDSLFCEQLIWIGKEKIYTLYNPLGLNFLSLFLYKLLSVTIFCSRSSVVEKLYKS